MIQNFDVNGLYEIPQLVLVNPNKKELGIISAPVSLNMTLRYNDVSEMSFMVYKDPKTIDDKTYSLLRKMRMIHVENIGYFPIYEVTEYYDGGMPYKEIKCYSAEHLLNYKPVNISFTTTVETTGSVITRSYKFYDDEYPDSTLMYLLFNDFFDWTFDFSSIDETLKSKYRSFNNTGVGLYGFLHDEVSSAYECVFIYDIENFVITAYPIDSIANNSDSDIYINFENLLKNATVTELSDSVNTVLAVSGGGGLTLSGINPTGTNNIYKFDYYLTDDWIGENVYAVDDDGNTRYFSKTSSPPAVAEGVNTDGTIRYKTGYAVGDPIPFAYRVKWWEAQTKSMIMNADVAGSYGWLVSQKTNLQGQYLKVQSDYNLNNQFYDTTTQALAAIDQQEALEDAEEAALARAENMGVIGKKKSIIAGIAMVFLGVVFLAAGIALTIASGGTALAPFVSSVASFTGLATTTVQGIIGSVGMGMAIGGLTSTTKGITQIISALQSEVTDADEPISATSTQLEALKTYANNNCKLLKGGNDVGLQGGYVTKCDAEAASNLLTNEDQPTSYIAQNEYYVSNIWDNQSSTDPAKKYALKPNIEYLSEGYAQYYSMYVLDSKINAINNDIKAQVDIYAYKNFFSETERKILEPFFIQSEYSDEAFTKSSYTTVSTSSSSYDAVLTDQGLMYVEEYKWRSAGYYFNYRANGGSDVEGLDLTPLLFNVNAFRNYMGLSTYYQHYYKLVYDIDNDQWGLYDFDEEGNTGNPVLVPFPITEESGIYSSGSTYEYQHGDFAFVYVYNSNIQLVDNNVISIQLAQQAYDSIDRVAEPKFSFSIEANNFIFQERYKSWTEQIGYGASATEDKYLGFGTTIVVQMDDDTVLTPYLQEININYDSPEEMSLTFGNKYDMSTQEWTASELFSGVNTGLADVKREQSRYSGILDTDDMSMSITSMNANIESVQNSITQSNRSIQANSSAILNLNSSFTTELIEQQGVYYPAPYTVTSASGGTTTYLGPYELDGESVVQQKVNGKEAIWLWGYYNGKLCWYPQTDVSNIQQT